MARDIAPKNSGGLKARPDKSEPNRNPRRDGKRLSSVTTAIHLLKEFSDDDPELGISALARRLSVAKSTVHRLAATLVEEGLLDQNPDNGRYALGAGLFTLGARVRGNLAVAREARPILIALRDTVEENARLCVLDGDRVVCLYDFEGPQPNRLRSVTGASRPAFCTAEGLCLAAGLREAPLAEFLDRPRTALTPRSVTGEAELRARIRQVKRRGHAIEDGEWDETAAAVAAPVRNAEGRLVAAIAVAAPRARLSGERPAEVAPIVIEAARAISTRLGYGPAQPIWV